MPLCYNLLVSIDSHWLLWIRAAVSDVIEWRSWPIRDDVPKSLLLVAVVLVVCVGVGFSFDGLGYGLIAVAILGVGLSRYFLPTRYTLDETGVLARFMGQTQRMPWSDVRRTLVHREGIHLSPFPEPSRLDSFRGVFLRFAGNADEVTPFVERHTHTTG